MSGLRIVIPSHKRHDRVFAKYLVNDPIICVAKSQADIYKQFNPDCEIVTHPDDVVGLIPKRNWMAKHFRNLFMLDDVRPLDNFEQSVDEGIFSLPLHYKTIRQGVATLFDE